MIDLTPAASARTRRAPSARAVRGRRWRPAATRSAGPATAARAAAWAWDWLEIGEHVGTHFDAPIHWVTGRDGEDVASVPVERLVGPAVVIDKSAEAAEDPDYVLTVEQVRAFEAEHGALPDGGWLLLRTGWDARAHDQAAFLAQRPGAAHPGVRRRVRPGPATRSASPASAWRRWAPTTAPRTRSTRRSPSTTTCSARGSYGLTQLANLARLPPTGAVLVVAPLKLVGGTGSPARVLALVPRAAAAGPSGRLSSHDRRPHPAPAGRAAAGGGGYYRSRHPVRGGLRDRPRRSAFAEATPRQQAAFRAGIDRSRWGCWRSE